MPEADPRRGAIPQPAGYRARLFEGYGDRVDALDQDRASKLAWFVDYVAENYLAILPKPPGEKTVADIGCSRGYLLEALSTAGYGQLVGVDLSPVDLEQARISLPGVDFVLEDGTRFLQTHPAAFDGVILRAMVEHTPKDDVIPLLEAARDACKPGGLVLVDVPNMDWLFAGHERYMDYTHEVGFTRESLSQVMGAVFGSVDIRLVEHISSSERRAWRNRLSRAVLGRLFRWADAQGAANPIWCRNLIGVGHK